MLILVVVVFVSGLSYFCSQSEENEFVPLLVAICVGIVESKGMQTQGLYRIPGNRASVTQLTEAVNKGPQAIDLRDPRYLIFTLLHTMLLPHTLSCVGYHSASIG